MARPCRCAPCVGVLLWCTAAAAAPVAARVAAPPAAPVAATSPAPAALAVTADSHRDAARRQSRDSPALRQRFARACAPSAAPPSAALAVQALQALEAEHQRERLQAQPDPERLRHTVVLRGCMAYHATRLQAGASYPVWWHTWLSIDSVRPASTGFEAQARVTTAHGAAATSRVTFSRGLHHACFVQTDADGRAGCTLVDTHPHGDRLNGWAEAHEGPLIATYAGSVSAAAVALPATHTRELPVFASLPAFAAQAVTGQAMQPAARPNPSSPARQ